MREIVDEALYIELFHGRSCVDEQMEGWGSLGPIIGPFEALHGTYRFDLKVLLYGSRERVNLAFYEDMVCYDEMFYGDYCITSGKMLKRDLKRFKSDLYEKHLDRVEEFDPEKNRLPKHIRVYEDL